jgi:small subunit ribosomal protein S14
MKYLKPKDFKHRIAFIQIEKKIYLLKAIINSSFLPKEIRFNARITLANIRKYGMPTKIRNRCLISSRGNSVDRVFKLARSKFNIYAGAGLLPGVRKSSW